MRKALYGRCLGFFSGGRDDQSFAQIRASRKNPSRRIVYLKQCDESWISVAHATNEDLIRVCHLVGQCLYDKTIPQDQAEFLLDTINSEFVKRAQ